MRISDWSSDVCSSDLHARQVFQVALADLGFVAGYEQDRLRQFALILQVSEMAADVERGKHRTAEHELAILVSLQRSEEHTSELQSLMRMSYAFFCLKKKTKVKIET